MCVFYAFQSTFLLLLLSSHSLVPLFTQSFQLVSHPIRQSLNHSLTHFTNHSVIQSANRSRFLVNQSPIYSPIHPPCLRLLQVRQRDSVRGSELLRAGHGGERVPLLLPGLCCRGPVLPPVLGCHGPLGEALDPRRGYDRWGHLLHLYGAYA